MVPTVTVSLYGYQRKMYSTKPTYYALVVSSAGASVVAGSSAGVSVCGLDSETSTPVAGLSVSFLSSAGLIAPVDTKNLTRLEYVCPTISSSLLTMKW